MPVKVLCVECKTENPEGKRYCGDCGALLGRSLTATIKDNLRDRKTVETEITEAVAERLHKWVKWFLFWTGIPVALLLVVVAFLGFKSYSDFSSKVDVAKAEVVQQLDSARQSLQASTKEIDNVREAANRLTREFKELESQLAGAKALNQKVIGVQKQLSSLQGQVNNWYQLMTTEIFNSPIPGRIHFQKMKVDEEDAFMVEITLKQVPIPASLKVVRSYFVINPAAMEVKGKTIKFTTYSDKFEKPEDAIVVQYHPQGQEQDAGQHP
jgi:hypothetical protein